MAKATKKAQNARPESRIFPANGLSSAGLEDVECAGGEVDRQDRQQHEHRPGQGVKEELDGRVLRPVLRLAPDADQEVHRHQAHLPEHVEKDQVQRHEDAEHAHFEQQEEEEELPHPHLDRPRRVPQSQRRQEGGEEDHRDAQPIHAHVIVDVEHGDPRRLDVELHAAGALVVAEPEHDRQPQRQQADAMAPFLISRSSPALSSFSHLPHGSSVSSAPSKGAKVMMVKSELVMQLSSDQSQRYGCRRLVSRLPGKKKASDSRLNNH